MAPFIFLNRSWFPKPSRRPPCWTPIQDQHLSERTRFWRRIQSQQAPNSSHSTLSIPVRVSYLADSTRLDGAFYVSSLAQNLMKPTAEHMQLLKHCLRYLSDTKYHGSLSNSHTMLLFPPTMMPIMLQKLIAALALATYIYHSAFRSLGAPRNNW